MNPVLQEAIGKLIRYGLMLAAGYLIKRGIWSEGEALNYITAAVPIILALGWSFWVTYRSRIKLLTALTLPAGSTENDVKAVIASGAATPSVRTSPDTAPSTILAPLVPVPPSVFEPPKTL